MNDYQTLPGLTGVYLEDSFVLSIHDEGGTLSFELDAVLTERHPRHTPTSSTVTSPPRWVSRTRTR